MSKMIQISDSVAAALDSVKVGSYSNTIQMLIDNRGRGGDTPGNTSSGDNSTSGDNYVETSVFPPMAYISDMMFSSGEWRFIPACAGAFGVNPDQPDEKILDDVLEVANDTMLIKFDTGSPEYPSYGVRHYGMPVPVFRRIEKKVAANE